MSAPIRGVLHAVRSTALGSLPLGVVGLSLWVVAVVRADFARMGHDGLITILGWPYFVGLALLVVGLAVELLRTPLRSPQLLLYVVGLIIVLFGTASAVEPTARLVDAWLHAGLVQYVFAHGHVLDNFDGRFSWPGGFSLGAVLASFTGQSNVVAFLRWAPLAFELLYLPPLLVIARCSGVGRRAGWLGVTLFYASNWIDQDYFSPQALNFLFFLVVVATVLASWRPARRVWVARTSGRVWRRVLEGRQAMTRLRLSGQEARAVWEPPVMLFVLGLLGLLCLASSMSHQLTPFMLTLALAACLLTRRLGRPEFLVVAALLAVGWLSLGASNYWEGHLSDVFGSIGNLGGIFGADVTHRITGSSSHRLVVDARILSIVLLFALGGVGIVRRAPTTRTLEALAGAPFLLLAVQNYGGEGLLRAALFGLPFLALLAASAIVPNRRGAGAPLVPQLQFGRHGHTVLAVGVVAVVLGFSVLTTFVRGGNDAYEAFSNGELSAVTFTYDHARPGESIGLVAPFLPIGQQDVGSVSVFAVADGLEPPTLQDVQATLHTRQPAWIILSHSQEEWGEIVAGYPRGWQSTLEGRLLHNGYTVAGTWPTATVLRATASGAAVSPGPSRAAAAAVGRPPAATAEPDRG
jgi:hypothetical protein